MRTFALTVLAAALLFGAGPVLAQNSEVEDFASTGARLQAEQREVMQANILLATQALQRQDYAAARKPAQAVTRADPKRIEAWLMLGAAQQGLQDWKAARGTYTTAVRLFPGHPEARAGLGIALARTQDPKATVQLAWFDAKVKECGTCWQAGQLARYKAEVTAAIATTPPKP